jgi:CubicO group peptidase (beta-lactamase class C family)
LKLFSTNTCHVPADLGSVTTVDFDSETAPEAAGFRHGQVENIWAAVEGLYKTGISPAITFCLRREGKIVINRAIGHASGNGPEDRRDTPKVLATPDTPVCLFSASKAITAMLIHLLDERGEIDLLDPISHYIPEYGVNGKKNATIYHLLSHRGGIPKISDGFDPEMLYDLEAVLGELYKARPVSPSGHRVAYHALTAGYIFGEIIERVTGKNVREFLREAVGDPMGMRFFNYGLPEQDRPLAAVNYNTGLKPVGPANMYIQHILGGDLELAVNMTNDPRFMDTICPAGNIYATAEEAGRFFQMLLDGGRYGDKQIFKPMTIKRALIEVGKPELDRSLLIPMRYSMGMMLGNSPVGMYGPMTRKAFGHLGLTNIFCWADPQRDTSVSLLTTGKPLVGTHVAALGKLLFTLSTQCPKASPERASRLDTGVVI